MRKAGRKLNNAGAALVTVIVVIAFISVVATVLLYSSSVNFLMKTADMKIKGNFYDAETTLEEIRAALVVRVSDAYKVAYRETMKDYTSEGSADAREELFKRNFIEEFKKKWDEDNTYGDDETLRFLQTMVEGTRTGDLVLAPAPAPATGEVKPELDINEAEGRIILRNVRVEHANGEYISIIQTDFIIRAPEVNWNVSVSATSWAPGDDAGALVRKEIDMVNSVNYLNWTKW